MKTNEQILWKKIDKLEEELLYHEKYLLSGDGFRCPCCDRVRHVDDCIKSDLTENFYCSKECADKASDQYERDLESYEEYEKSIDDAFFNR